LITDCLFDDKSWQISKSPLKKMDDLDLMEDRGNGAVERKMLERTTADL